MSQVRAATGDDNGRVDPARPLLELTGATVRFGEETALDAVDFRMFPGEVHSLMGENGAGKSTLIKAITGALPMESGILRLAGQQVTFATPHDCPGRGHQHGLPGDRAAAERVGGREHRARSGAAQVRPDRLARHASERCCRAARAGVGHRPRLDPRHPSGGGAAAGRDRAGHLHRRQGARPRRADVEPGPQRGGRALPRDPRAQEARRRHPVRLALPRPGLRDLRPCHRPARRTTRRGVPDERSAARRPGPEDAGSQRLRLPGQSRRRGTRG